MATSCNAPTRLALVPDPTPDRPPAGQTSATGPALIDVRQRVALDFGAGDVSSTSLSFDDEGAASSSA